MTAPTAREAVTIAFIVGGYFFAAVAKATAAAILISTLTAVIWYALATYCLFVLRRKEPDLFRPYKVPIYPLNPIFVALLAIFAAYVYAWVNVSVVLPTAALYLGALLWYGIRGRKKVLPVAPEEVAARIAEQLARQQPTSDLAAVAASSPTTRRHSRAYVIRERASRTGTTSTSFRWKRSRSAISSSFPRAYRRPFRRSRRTRWCSRLWERI